MADPIEAQLRRTEEIDRHHKPLPDSLKNGAHSLAGAIQYLEAHNSMEDNAIGYSGARSKVFDAYKILRQEADNERLFKLLQSETPAARVYAFVTLVRRDSAMHDKAWSQLREKKDVVHIQSGCTGDYDTVDRLCISPPEFVTNPVEAKEIPLE